MDCFIKSGSIKLSQLYHVISLLTMRFHFYISIRLLRLLLKTIFRFWQMHYLRLSGHKNIWGWRCLLEHCHEWIWFNFKHWKTNLKAILEAPQTVFGFSCDTTHKMSEHCRWVSPPTPSANGIMPSEQWALLSPGGWGKERKSPKESGLNCPKNVWWLYVNSTELGPHICSWMN